MYPGAGGYQPYETYPPTYQQQQLSYPPYGGGYGQQQAQHPANKYYYEKRYTTPSQHLGHNKNYWHPLGWMRLLILIATLGGVITSWCIISSDPSFATLDAGFMATRSALIVIFSVWFSISLFIFVMSLSNFVNLPGIDSKIYLYVFIFLDICGALAFIGVGIAAAVKEANLIWLGASALLAYRPGTFTACAVFAFFTAIMQLASAAYQAWIVYEFEYV